MSTRFVEVHALQPLPFSCINRDDGNRPKSMPLGGTRRARWSSQSQKRGVRMAFPRYLGQDKVSMRTRRLPLLVLDVLTGQGRPPEEAPRRVLAAFEAAGIATKATSSRKAVDDLANEVEDDVVIDEPSTALPGTVTKASPGGWNGLTQVIQAVHEVNAPAIIAHVVADHWDALGDGPLPTKTAEAVKAGVILAMNATSLADVALFGRMLTEIPTHTVEAAASVAHGFTTHPDDIESDFWSAVDDKAVDQGHGGSANMGIQAFTSGCFYRYAVVDIETLRADGHPLAQDPTLLRDAVAAFLTAFVRLRPTAMQHSTAPYADPALVVVAATDHQRHLGDAFIRPVGGDYLRESAERLRDTWDAWATAYSGAVSGHYILAHPDVAETDLGPTSTHHRTLTDAVVAATVDAFDA